MAELKPFTGELDAADVKPFDGQLDGEKPGKGFGSDVVTALKQGAQQLPGMVAGIADIPAGMAGFDRPVSKLADRVGKATGFTPGKWAQEQDANYSQATKDSKAAIDAAWEDPKAGALDVAGAYVANPRATALNVVQSVPSMAAGGVVGRGLGVVSGLSGAARGAIGEGAVMAGQTQSQIDESVDPQRAAAAALATGVGGAAVGYGAGRLAQRMGVADVDTLMAGRTAADATHTAASPGLAKSVALDAAQEALLEEAPQSALEQGAQNWAEGKELTEGMARNVVEGALAGGVMGAGAGAVGHMTPAQKMGIDENAGPLSKAGATAVNSGAHLALPAPTVTVDSEGTAKTAEQRNDELQDPGVVETGAMGQGRNSDPVEPAPEALPGLPALEYDTSPTGRMIAGEDGVRSETRAEAVNRQQVLGEQQAETEAARQARVDLGQSPYTPVRPVEDAVPAQEVRQIPLDTTPTGTLVVGADGVARPEIRAEQINREQAAREVIRNRVVAGRMARDAGPGHEVVAVEGGFAVRPVEDAAPRTDGLVPATRAQEIDAEASNAATSPDNERPQPTQAQKEAGNYAKGHIKLQGLDISIENPRGSQRSGQRPDGSTWTHDMSDHYGYIKRTVGADNEQVDVYVGPKPDSQKVFVVDQLDQQSGKFDEHKVMLGYDNPMQAAKAYRSNFDKGWKTGPIKAMSMEEFKTWLKQGDTKAPTNAAVASATQAVAQPPAVASVPVAAEPTATAGKEVSRDAGQHGEGMGEFRAKQRRAELAKENPAVTYTVEEDHTLKNGYVVVGRQAPKTGTKGAKLAPQSVPSEPLAPTTDSKLDQTASTAVPAAPDAQAKIADLGEKIGGARKDTAISTGERGARAKTADERPAWARRFAINQVVSSSRPGEEGRWFISDTRSLDWRKQPKRVGASYATQEEAESMLSVVAVARKHRALPTGGGKYEIWRDIADRKRVKVVDQEFASREDALQYMAQHAADILDTNTTFGEADLPAPPDRRREGPQRRDGNVDGKAFMDTFGFRGVEFGNWNNQDDRQHLMNDAYDGLLDLAEVLDIPAKAIGLNGDLGLAFGARGQGLSGARAHYETDRVVINLTKENGAGSLAHEWFHGLDHYFARLDGKAPTEWETKPDGTRTLKLSGNLMASEGFSRNSGVREVVRKAFDNVFTTMTKKGTAYVEDAERADRFVGTARQELQSALDSIRSRMAEGDTYSARPKKATAEQLVEFDTIVQRLINGDATGLVRDWRSIATSKSKIAHRWTNDSLEAISQLYKAATGRSGFDGTNRRGVLDSLGHSMERYSQRLKLLADAQEGSEKVRMVPTEFAQNAKELDQGRGSDYWTTAPELAARAFQGYVEDKIAERGGSSRFLNYGPENAGILTPWGFKRPFPQGEERKAINGAFDKLVDALETRKTNSGTALFSRDGGARPAPTAEEIRRARLLLDAVQRAENPKMATVETVRAAVRQLVNGLGAMPDGLGRIVVATAADIKAEWEPLIGPVDIKSESHGNAQGFYSPQTKTVFLIADHIREGDELGVAAHELMHKHGQAVLGKDGWDQLHSAISGWKNAGADSLERQVYNEAAARVEASGAHLSNQELFPYAVQVAFEMGVQPNAAAPQNSVGRWLATVRKMLRKAWDKITNKPMLFGAQDMVNLAFGIAQMENPEHATSLATSLDKQKAGQTLPLRRATNFLQARRAVAEFQGKPLTNLETGMVASVSRGNLDKMLSEKAVSKSVTTSAHTQAVANVDRLFAAAHLEESHPDRKNTGAIAAMHRFYAPMEFDGKSLRVKLTVKEFVSPKDGNRIYTVEAMDLEMGKKEGPPASMKPELPQGGVEGGEVETSLAHPPGGGADASSLPQGGKADKPADSAPQFSRALHGSSVPDLTPEQQKAWSNVAGIKEPPTLKDRIVGLKANLGLRLQQGIVDQFAPIKDVSQEAYMQARLSKGSDGTMEAAMLYGKPFLRDGVPDVDVKDGGFAQVMASLKGEHDRFLMWVAAQRAERLKSEGKENLFTDDDISALKSLNAGRFADGGARLPVYAKALNDLNAFNDAVLKVAEQSGLIDKEALDLFKGQPYVPFYRVMEDGDMKGPRFSAGLVNQQAYKKLKGGTNQLNGDLLQNMLLNWSHLYSAAARNRAALATMDGAGKMGVAYPVAEGTKGAIKVMREGLTEHWAVEDPYLLEAISALNYVPSPLIKPLAVMKQVLTFGVTVNPTFKIRNLIRDSLSAVAQTDLSYNPLENVAKGWKATAKDSQIHASMLAGGGTIKFGTGESSERVRNEIKKLGGELMDEQGLKKVTGLLRKTWDAYNELGDRAENVNRAALYERLIEKGHSPLEANYMARDLMDFSMSGKWPAVRFLTQTVPFMNARLQGLYKLGRAAAEDPRRFGTMAAAVSLASLGLMAAYGDDDDWKKREDFDRDSYWWFKIGETAYRIPKPFELGSIGTIAERTAELMLDDEMTGARFRERLSSMVFQTFAMDPVPQAFKPLLDVYSNKDSFTKRAIEGQGDEKLRPQDRIGERTSEVARLLGQLGLPEPLTLLKGEYKELSPKQVDFLLRGYFSWVGSAAATMTDLAARPLLDRGERPEMRLKDTFLAGSFVESLPSGSSRYVSQLYDQSRDVEQAWASYRDALKRGDTEKAADIREAEAPLLRNRLAVEQAKKQLTALNQQARQVEANKAMSAEMKRQRLDRIEQQRDAVARRVPVTTD